VGPDDLLLVVMLAALTLYAVLGGADFGAGIWEFTTAFQSSERERDHIYRAIGPVWEANHVWLIFVVVILANGFPLAFAALSRALWLPLFLALAGIVCRGASYVFRSYGLGASRENAVWEAVFALASTAAPLFMGASVGAVASGTLAINASGGFEGDYLTGWLSALSVFTAFYGVGMCAYLAAVYLVREAHQRRDEQLQSLWRRRSLSTGLWMGLLSVAGVVMVRIEAPMLADGFRTRGWPLVALSMVCGMASLVELWRCHFTRAAIASAGAVAAVIWGWGVSQYPLIISPSISKAHAKAPDNVIWMMLVVISLGAVLLLPSLAYLFFLFKLATADSVWKVTR
jgi:cytochrome d ubiquinol oxidase subunit II